MVPEARRALSRYPPSPNHVTHVGVAARVLRVLGGQLTHTKNCVSMVLKVLPQFVVDVFREGVSEALH